MCDPIRPIWVTQTVPLQKTGRRLLADLAPSVRGDDRPQRRDHQAASGHMRVDGSNPPSSGSFSSSFEDEENGKFTLRPHHAATPWHARGHGAWLHKTKRRAEHCTGSPAAKVASLRESQAPPPSPRRDSKSRRRILYSRPISRGQVVRVTHILLGLRGLGRRRR